MKPVHAREDEARRLIERLIKISPDDGLTARALKLRDRLKLPMWMVIDKIPGETMVAKAKRIGVSRQTIYYWLSGETRPNKKQARLLATLTGFDAAEIRGRASVDRAA